MKTGLIIFGVIFLVLGGLLYIYPSQTVGAQTSSVGSEGRDVRTSSAIFDIPIEWSYGLMIIGGILLILGLVIPEPVKVVQGFQGPRGPRGSRGKAARRPARKISRGAALPKGTSVTTTTRIRR